MLPKDDTDFSTRWALIKSNFKRMFRQSHPTPAPSEHRKRNREQGVWQSRFWEHYIDSDADYNKYLDYIHFNPVQHGYVSDAGDWPHSSFHDYVAQGVYSADWQIDAFLALTDQDGMDD